MKALKILFLSAAAALTMASTAPTASAETRRALVIGLGEQLDPAWKKINGDRDVPIITEMLVRNGFSDIATLLNTAATKDAIVAQLQALAARAGHGDVVYVHFSGHGQLVTDTDGDEPDGLDEAWIPYDAYQRYSADYHGEKHLVDDEVNTYLRAIRAKIGPQGVIAVTVDACHSGDSTRALGDEGTTDGGDAIRGVSRIFTIPGAAPAARTAPAPEEWITLSACQNYQLNQEYRGVGRLTYILANNWSSYAGLSNSELLEQINALMQTRRFKTRLPQEPAMSGDVNNLFSSIFR